MTAAVLGHDAWLATDGTPNAADAPIPRKL